MKTVRNIKTPEDERRLDRQKREPVQMVHSPSGNHERWIATAAGFIAFNTVGSSQIQFWCGENREIAVVFRLYPNAVENGRIKEWLLAGGKSIAASDWNGETQHLTCDIEAKPILALHDASLDEWCEHLAKHNILPPDGVEAARFHIDMFMRQYVPASTGDDHSAEILQF